MASSIGVGNHKIESVELNSSAFNVHSRIQLDSSLITGNDVYVSPTGSLTEDGPYEFTLNGDSSFHKILNSSRLFGEFHLVDLTTNELINKHIDLFETCIFEKEISSMCKIRNASKQGQCNFWKTQEGKLPDSLRLVFLERSWTGLHRFGRDHIGTI